NSYWQVRLGWGWRLMLLWMIVLNYMKSQESAAGDPEISRREMQRAYLVLPFALCIGLLSAVDEHSWAAMAMGIVCATFFWADGRVFGGRFYSMAIGGWLLGGAAAGWLSWPNEQRFDFVFVMGGLATVLQGAWEILSYLRSRTSIG